MTDTCIQCHRTADEIIASRSNHIGAALFTRPRPTLRNSEYQICGDCARTVKAQQDERAQEAIKQAERAGA